VRYRTVWFASLVVASCLLVGAGLEGLARSAQQEGGTLRISRGRDIDSVDPALAYLPDSWMLQFATCAKLYNYPDKPAPQGAIPVPEVATGFPEVSRDGRTQTIRLRRTYRFHTGQRVTAANFVAAFNRNASPKLESPAITYLHEIVGADAVIDGRAETISGVKALARYTLQIRTTRPLSDLVSRLTMPFFCPIAVNTPREEIQNPPGSGPYYVASRIPNRQVALERNRFYRGPRPANVDQIVLTIRAPGACRAAVEQDEIDYCAGGGVPPADYPEIAAKYGINEKGGRFFFNPTLAVNYIAFNHDRPAFKGRGQIPLKKAINWAIDRPALARAVGYLAGRRTDQILPPAMTESRRLYPLEGASEGSLRTARALLRQARFKPEKLVLYAFDLAYGPAWAQIVTFNLRRLGIDVEIRYFDFDSYGTVTGSRGAPFDISIGGWNADYADGQAFFRPLLHGSSIAKSANFNTAYFDRPFYNRSIERIEKLSGGARHKAWAGLDVRMMRDDPPWAPVTTGVSRDFVSKSFGCFVFQPVIGRPSLAAACKK
jgi:peptide/nickel transport system substrate-binding protein